MSPPNDNASPANDHPASRLIKAGLQRTTPAFEARFDELQRRLATSPGEPSVLKTLLSLLSGRLVVAAAVAVLIGFIALWRVTTPPGELRHDADVREFGELVALSETLRGALPLADPAMREAVLEMPSQK